MLIVRVLMNERGFQNGIYLVGKHKVERFAHRRVDLIKVRLVIGGDYNRGDSVPHCGHRLFLEAADRQDAAAQAYLARHCDVAAHRSSREGGNDRRAHGHAGRRSVLRYCALGKVDVYTLVL